MKKVLVIGHFWPYRGGSRRMLGLAKYLSFFGWEPIIITGPLLRKPSGEFRFIETSCREVFDNWKRFFKFLGIRSKKSTSREIKKKLGISSHRSFIDFLILSYLAVFAYPDSFKGWRSSALRAAREIIEKEDISAVISVWPVTSHIIAKELGVFWVSDFPDLWSKNADYSFGPIRRFFDKRLEVKTLKKADALVVLSEYDKKTQQKIHKGKMIYVIPHGYYPDEVNDPPIRTTDKFTLTYAGTFYNKRRDPSNIFRALRDLIDEGSVDINDIEIRFYGPKESWISKIAKQNNLFSVLKQEGVVERRIVLEKEKESQVLILFKWEDSKEKGIYSGKIFEYLAARRPILASGGIKDVASALLEETNAGIDALSFQEVKSALKKMYSEYKEKGYVLYEGDIDKIKNYSSKEMAAKFARILDEKD